MPMRALLKRIGHGVERQAPAYVYRPDLVPGGSAVGLRDADAWQVLHLDAVLLNQPAGYHQALQDVHDLTKTDTAGAAQHLAMWPSRALPAP
jgi:hypothetical protein